jgi:TIR domain
VVRVFISYRRGDASAWAGRLRDGLTARLDEDDVYQDVVTVDAGEDFALSIDSALERCDVVLAVIGPQWLSIVGTDGNRRLDDPDDYVRIELGRALALNKRVIPVLVGGATMPAADRLPDDLTRLGLRQALTLDDATWRRDVDDLVNRLLGPPRSRWHVPVALGAVVAAVAVVVVVWALTRDRRDGSVGAPDGSVGVPDGSVGVPDGSVGVPDGSVGVEEQDLNTTIRPCATPGPPEWVDLAMVGSEAIGVTGQWAAWDVEVLSVQAQEDPPAWDLILDIEATNRGIHGTTFFPSFLTVVIGGREVRPACWSVIGGAGDAPNTGGTTKALVGFDALADDPMDGFALDIETPSAGRINLAPATNS